MNLSQNAKLTKSQKYTKINISLNLQMTTTLIFGTGTQE